MCNFFSFCTMPDSTSDFYYFDWQMRQADKNGADSHSHICAHFRIDEDRCNKYEYNPLTGVFTVDMRNAVKDDSKRAEKWVKQLDFKTVIEPLIIKPIVNPFELPKVEIPTDEQINWLIEWASVGDSVRASVGASVGALVGDSVRDSVWASVRASVGDSVGDSVRASVGASVGALVGTLVWDSVWDSIRDSVWDSVWAYISSFFAVKYSIDFSSAIKLWESGLAPTFDGETWRLHTGKHARVVYEWKKEVKYEA